MEKEDYSILSIGIISIVIVYLVIVAGCVYPFCKDEGSSFFLTPRAVGEESGGGGEIGPSAPPRGDGISEPSGGDGNVGGITYVTSGDDTISLDQYSNKLKFVDGFENIVFEKAELGNELGRFFVQTEEDFDQDLKALPEADIKKGVITNIRDSTNDPDFVDEFGDYLDSVTKPFPLEENIDVMVSEEGTVIINVGDSVLKIDKNRIYSFSISAGRN